LHRVEECTAGADLRLDREALTWVVTAYTLCFGGLMLLGCATPTGGGRPVRHRAIHTRCRAAAR
jgi:hypothetical protein